MAKIIKKTAIITGYNCNNRCRFCIYANRRHVCRKKTKEIIREMISARKRHSTHLVLVGGEPFIREDIIYLVSKAKELRFKEIIAATNGRMFAYKDFAKKIIDSGITELYFSIHGHNAKLHDYLTRVPGSFSQLLKGIENIKSLGFKRFGSHTTIVRPNYRFLPNLGRLICGLGIKSADFVFVDPNYGGAYKYFNELVPRVSEIIPYLKRCLDIGKQAKTGHWAVRYVPICKLNGYEEYVSDIKDIKMVHTEHIAPDFKDYYVEKTRRMSCRIKTKRCLGCRYYIDCEGIWKNYIKHLGDQELKAIISPSFLKKCSLMDEFTIINRLKFSFLPYLEECRGPIVDIATGEGKFLLTLRDLLTNKEFIALDVKIEPLLKESLLRDTLSKGIHCVLADARKLPFIPNFTDCVISYLGFNYIPYATQAFNETYRVLRKNGRLMFASVVVSEWSLSYKKALKDHREKMSTTKNILTILSKTKFKNIKIKEIMTCKVTKTPYDNDNLYIEGDECKMILVYAEK